MPLAPPVTTASLPFRLKEFELPFRNDLRDAGNACSSHALGSLKSLPIRIDVRSNIRPYWPTPLFHLCLLSVRKHAQGILRIRVVGR